MPKRMEIGDEIYAWNFPEELKEFKERVKKADKELEDRKRITFYMEVGYQRSHSPKIKLFYKNTITKFKPMEMGGQPVYKDKYIQFVPYRTNEGELLSRCITANPEQVAFLDMKEGFIREEDKPLTPLQKKTLEARKLKEELEKLKGVKEEGKQPVVKKEPVKATSKK